MNRLLRWILREPEITPDPEQFDNPESIEYRFLVDALQAAQNYQRKLMELNQRDSERRRQYDNRQPPDIYRYSLMRSETSVHRWVNDEWRRVQQQINLLITGNPAGMNTLVVSQDPLDKIKQDERERKERMWAILRGDTNYDL